MRRLWDYAKLLGALGLVFLLLLWPTEALSAAQGAMRTWAGSVGPSLFPFLALLPALTCPAARRAYARALGWLMRPLFRLPGSAAPALLIGLLAGSPAGALAVERVSEGLPRGEARRLGLMCAGVSPVYLVGGVGAALFGAAEMGLWLALAQAVGQLLLGLLLRGRFAEDAELLPALPEREREAPVRAAVASVLQVCGYMALFSVAAAMAAKLLGARQAIYYYISLTCPPALPARRKRARPGRWRARWRALAASASPRRTWPCSVPWACAGGTTWPARGFVATVCTLALHLRFSARVAAAPAMARLETGALEASTLAAMLLLLPALLAVACDGRGKPREKPNS